MTSGQVLNMANDECRLDQEGLDADFFKRGWPRMNADGRGFFQEEVAADERGWTRIFLSCLSLECCWFARLNMLPTAVVGPNGEDLLNQWGQIHKALAVEARHQPVANQPHRVVV